MEGGVIAWRGVTTEWHAMQARGRLITMASREGHGVSNRQQLDCLFNGLSTTKTSMFSFWEDPPVTDVFPLQREWERRFNVVPSSWGISGLALHGGISSGPFYLYLLTLIPAGISIYTNQKLWGEIAYLFPNSNVCAMEVWEWISNFISLYWACVYLFIMLVLKLIYVIKRGPNTLIAKMLQSSTKQLNKVHKIWFPFNLPTPLNLSLTIELTFRL